MRSPTETAHLIDSHYRRSFGRSPDNEMREFIRKAAENGLTLDELLNCMTAAVVTYGFGAYERDYRKVFVAEARKAGFADLQIEQVGMGAGSGKCEDKLVFVQTVNQQPIRSDMAFSETGVIAFEGMIFIARWKRNILLKQVNNRF